MALRALVLVAITTVAAVVLVASAGAGRTAVAANAKTFTDPEGDADDGLAPDFTSVAVSNDDEGTLTFQVTVPNRSSWADDDFVGVYLNTDGKTSTGCSNTHGGDYTLAFLGKAATLTNYFVLLHCKGKDYDTSTLQGSFKASLDLAAHTLTFSVNRRDIGSPKRISMFLISTSQDAKYLDIAPDSGDWSYDVIAPPAPTYRDGFAEPGQEKPHAAPVPAKARTVQVLVRWEDPADTFDLTGVELIDASGRATPARIARVRRPDKLCSLAGCRTRRGTLLIVDVVPKAKATAGFDPFGQAAARRIRFTVRSKHVTHQTHVRTEVVAKKSAERKRLFA